MATIRNQYFFGADDEYLTDQEIANRFHKNLKKALGQESFCVSERIVEESFIEEGLMDNINSTIEAIRNFFKKSDNEEFYRFERDVSLNFMSLSKLGRLMTRLDYYVKSYPGASITVLASAAGALAYGAYKLFTAKKGKDEGARKAIESIKKVMRKCKDSEDPQKCQERLESIIKKYEEKGK